MKRNSRLLTLVALILSALLLFAACGSDNAEMPSVLDKNATGTITPIYTKLAKIEALDGAEAQAINGSLVYLTKNVTSNNEEVVNHIVYNLKNDVLAFTATTSEDQPINVDLHDVTVNDKDVPYFVVTKENEDGDIVETSLYDANGVSILSVQKSVDIEAFADLIYVEGKCYRASEAGTFAHAFDFSPLAKFPEVSMKYGNLYYAGGEHDFTVYNDKLEYQSHFYLPEGCDDDAMLVLLANGNIMVQVILKEDTTAAQYTLLNKDGDKMTVKTYIFNVGNGEVEEIECNYIIEDFTGKNTAKRMGLVTDSDLAYAVATRIESKYQVLYDANRPATLVTVDNDGKIAELPEINGATIQNIRLVTAGAWMVETANGCSYLINAEGKVIAEVTNAKAVVGNYIVTEDKIYNTSMNVVCDLAASNLSVYGSLSTGFLLENEEEEEIYLFTGSGTPTKIIDKDSNLSIEEYTSNYYMVGNEEDFTYNLYNAAGTLLMSFGDDLDNFMTAASADDVRLLIVDSNETGLSYYRLTV